MHPMNRKTVVELINPYDHMASMHMDGWFDKALKSVVKGAGKVVKGAAKVTRAVILPTKSNIKKAGKSIQSDIKPVARTAIKAAFKPVIYTATAPLKLSKPTSKIASKIQHTTLNNPLSTAVVLATAGAATKLAPQIFTATGASGTVAKTAGAIVPAAELVAKAAPLIAPLISKPSVPEPITSSPYIETVPKIEPVKTEEKNILNVAVPVGIAIAALTLLASR